MLAYDYAREHDIERLYEMGYTAYAEALAARFSDGIACTTIAPGR